MNIKSFGRNLEKKALRPLFRRLKRIFRASGAHDRIAVLEQRVELLESLFREQAGLHYLRFAGDPAATPDGDQAHGDRRRTA